MEHTHCVLPPVSSPQVVLWHELELCWEQHQMLLELPQEHVACLLHCPSVATLLASIKALNSSFMKVILCHWLGTWRVPCCVAG